MNTRTPKAPRRRGGGHAKIDWGAAFAYFASDPTVSYGDVARRFGVSDTAVRNHARPTAENWIARRQAFIDKATERNEHLTLKTLEERQADTIRLAQKLRKIALADDAPIDVELAVRMLPAYAKLEQLYAGEATDRVSFAEYQAGVRVLFEQALTAAREVAAELLGDGSAEFVVAFRARFMARANDAIEETAA